MALYINGNKMSGGTTVIANPEGSPTDELSSIQIGNDIYEIIGGSSGGDILIKDRDWTLITSSFGTTQLTNTYDYYLWIVICNGKIDYYKIIDSSLLDLETNEDSIIEYKSWNDGQGAYSDSRVIITASSVTLWDNNQEAVSAKLYGANAQSGSGMIDYSTTEQKTGQKWIDGKDIYQITKSITIETSGDTLIEANFGSNKNIIDIKGTAYVPYSNVTHIFPLPGYPNDNNPLRFIVYFAGDDLRVSAVAGNANITFKYTKTT